jgi:hypothetical protein
MDKIDFAKAERELYSATGKIKEVVAERAVFLAVDGHGAPGSELFQAAIGALYGAAYTIKFTMKKAGACDFAVSRLECVWDVDDPQRTPVAQWRWRLLIRVPAAVTVARLKEAKRALQAKGQDADAVQRISWKEGRALQTMHLGPYDQVSVSYARLGTRAEELGLAPVGPGHEIYVSDPRRVPPERCKTIVRLGVR